MKYLVIEQKKLIAEFLANIGVAWFAAGVISIFINKSNDTFQTLRSLGWGIGFSLIFILIGVMIIRKGKSK